MPIYPGILAAAGVSAVPTEPWVYPLPTSWTDRGQKAPTDAGTWNLYHWNAGAVIDLDSTVVITYEAGDGWGDAVDGEHVTHNSSNYGKTLGAIVSSNGTDFTELNNGDPVMIFGPISGNPGASLNPGEEGFWYHTAYVLGGTIHQVFGGQTGLPGSTTQVDIGIYYHSSTNAETWSPGSITTLTQAVAARLISYDDDHNTGDFQGITATPGEIAPGGLWHDGTLWHLIYLGKNVAGEEWSIYHVDGPDITPVGGGTSRFNGADSNRFLMKANNPFFATKWGDAENGQIIPSCIVDRGAGHVDVIAICTNSVQSFSQGGTNGAIVRIPVLPDYTWDAPGEPEILYDCVNDFAAPVGFMQAQIGAFLNAQLLLMPYNFFKRQTPPPAGNQVLRLKTAPIVRTSDGKLAYSPVSTRFNPASQNYLRKTSIFTGQADSRMVTGAFAVKLASLPSDEFVIFRFESTTYRFLCNVQPSGALLFLGRTNGGTNLLEMTTASTMSVDTWYTVVFSFLTGDYAASWCYFNGANAKPGSAALWTSTSAIGFSVASTIFVGAGTTTPTKLLDGELCDLGIHIGVHMPFSDAVLRQFVTAASTGRLQNPRLDGRGWFRRKPHLFLSGAGGVAFTPNKGSGGNFNTINPNADGFAAGASAPEGHP